MSVSRAPADHEDLLYYVAAKKAEKAVEYDKPDWMEHQEGEKAEKKPGAPRTPRRPLELLVHNSHTPSRGDFERNPAPFLEDGVSIWEREGTAKKKRRKMEEGREEESGGEGEKEDDDLRWNVKRRSPVKKLEGEFEKDFRSRESYTGNHKEEEEEEKTEEKKETKQNKEEKSKVKIPDHLRCDPIWKLK